MGRVLGNSPRPRGRAVIYLDNCATTPPDPRVIDRMTRLQAECFGNPSSIHTEGRRAAKALADARGVLASSIGARPSEIVATASGTEANNLVLSSIVQQSRGRGRARIVTSNVEHASVRNRLQWERRASPEGVEIIEVPVSTTGLLDMVQLEKSITPETRLLSLLYCNNETGVLQDLDALKRVRLANPDVLLHLDIVQAYLKLDLDVRTLPVDFLTVSAHKIHGPKGAAFLYVRDGIDIEPLLVGGAQEKFRRGGTENVAAVVGFAEAVAVHPPAEELRQHLAHLETVFLTELERQGVAFQLNGETGWPTRMPGIFNISLGAVKNREDLQIALDLEGVQVSSTSACSSGVVKASHVLRAMELPEAACAGAIRIGMSRMITESQARMAAETLGLVVKRIV